MQCINSSASEFPCKYIAEAGDQYQQFKLKSGMQQVLTKLAATQNETRTRRSSFEAPAEL